MSLKYEKLIRKMTLAEKAVMMSGKNTWETVDFEKYGIPSMAMSDGPHGLRRQAGAGDHLGLNASLPATCFPTAAGVANSWDEALGEEIGEALAEEAVTMGVNVILGPGLNIKRSPLCGRNFEYFSEDPYHAGKMAAAYVRGIQSKGIAACPKHFAANSQELRRMANDSVVDERTFREIYTTGFEIAIKEGKSKSIMSSYNEVNGIYANENNHMLQEILVDEWGFDGFVVSDWGGSNDHALGVKNGSHLEMPGTGKSGMYDIIHAVENGDLDEAVLDQRLDELLNVIFSTHQATEDAKGKTFDVEAHHNLARKAAEESKDELENAIKGADLVFIAAGLGGGTGTGAAPVVAQIAKECGALTVGFVTMPFWFEGAPRKHTAETGFREMMEAVDNIVKIPNDKLLDVVGKSTPLMESFKLADDALRQGIQGLTELIAKPAIINLDFADVKTIMLERGTAHMGMGVGYGENKVVDATKQAIMSPLLDTSIQGAKGIIFNIVGDKTFGLPEIEEAFKLIQEAADPDANVIMGADVNMDLDDEVRVTLIATGFGAGSAPSPSEVKETIKNKVNDYANANAGASASRSLNKPVTPVSSTSGTAEKSFDYLEPEDEPQLPLFLKKSPKRISMDD